MAYSEDVYKTIIKPSEGVFRDKGSKFIAYAYPILSEHEIKPILGKLKAEHPKARHWCWAMRLTPDRTVFRFNDDGEPSGSAGRPILNVLLSLDVTNILVVVVRYFGGTLLGVPGLINAYKVATQLALENNQIVKKSVLGYYKITFEYLVMNDVMKLLKAYQIEIDTQEFDNVCKISILIPKLDAMEVLGKLQKIESLHLQFMYYC
ncbi:MAG: YigZ family protein [Pedobacter sp.]|nr:MAG: YigZ family protein [Pedobacter sp.]